LFCSLFEFHGNKATTTQTARQSRISIIIELGGPLDRPVLLPLSAEDNVHISIRKC
jgi:hypothetical protein